MNIQFVRMITNAVSITTQVVMLLVRMMTYGQYDYCGMLSVSQNDDMGRQHDYFGYHLDYTILKK